MTDPVAKLEYSVAPGTRRSLWQTSVDAIVPYLLLFILAAISAAAACVAVAGATTERVIGLFGAVLFGLAAIVSPMLIQIRICRSAGRSTRED